MKNGWSRSGLNFFFFFFRLQTIEKKIPNPDLLCSDLSFVGSSPPRSILSVCSMFKSVQFSLSRAALLNSSHLIALFITVAPFRSCTTMTTIPSSCTVYICLVYLFALGLFVLRFCLHWFSFFFNIVFKFWKKDSILSLCIPTSMVVSHEDFLHQFVKAS